MDHITPQIWFYEETCSQGTDNRMLGCHTIDAFLDQIFHIMVKTYLINIWPSSMTMTDLWSCFATSKMLSHLTDLSKKIYMMNSTKNGALGHVKRIWIWVANKRIFFSSSFGWPRNHAYEGATLPDPTWCCRRLADELSESCCRVVDERSASQPETTWCSRSLAGERHASRHSSTSRRKQGAPGGSAPQAS